MNDLGDPHGTRPAASTPALSSRRRRGSARSGRKALIIGVLVLVAAVAAWFAFRPGGEEPPSQPPVATGPGTQEPAPSLPAAPALDLPDLGASDAFVRDVVSRLSAHPQLAAWLVPDDLVVRFVGVMVDMAGRFTPASHVRHIGPGEPFSTTQDAGRTVISEASFARFDLLAATAASLDARGTAELYVQLLPLMEEAYADLGIPGFTFQETFELAVRNVLAVEVPDGPYEVEDWEGLYVFSDPALEERRGLDKQLIRMGPQNARLLQASLREVAAALGIDP